MSWRCATGAYSHFQPTWRSPQQRLQTLPDWNFLSPRTLRILLTRTSSLHTAPLRRESTSPATVPHHPRPCRSFGSPHFLQPRSPAAPLPPTIHQLLRLLQPLETTSLASGASSNAAQRPASVRRAVSRQCRPRL